MSITLKSAYEKPAPHDGHRILVDRLWPRGVSKEAIAIEEWMKDVAPSEQLRKAFHGGELSWGEFRKRYLAELKEHRDELRRLAELSEHDQLTLVFSAHDKSHNNAVVVQQYLKMLGVP
jgi:uncharacterized protein YeaO (DUF488 family)